MHPRIFFSNRTEWLIQELKGLLFSGSSPFCKRLVIVSSPLMKSWIQWQLAKDPEFEIAMGLEVCYLNQAIGQLASLLDPGPCFFPSQLELSLAIEKELVILAEEGAKPLIQDLDHEVGKNWKKSSLRRLAKLSSELASLFNQYGIYGSQLIGNWGEGWQQLLWHRLWKKHPNWSYPLSRLVPLMEREYGGKKEVAIHVFGLSFLPNLYLNFLNAVGRSIPVNYYLVSPCQEFWSDLPSDREMGHMAPEIDFELLDRHPLLGNLGKLGRQMAAQIEESDAIIDFEYYVSEEGSLLQELQKDLVEMGNTLPAVDRSIQVHVAPSPAREVQILRDNLLHCIEEHGVEPNEILVMAPDILLYEPHIEAVFGSDQCPIDYQIYDLKLATKSTLVQAFIALLDLASSRWEASRVIQFFEYPPVMEALHLTEEEVNNWRKWVKESGVRWGYSEEHRREILKEEIDYQGDLIGRDSGTWELGLRRLLTGLVMKNEKELEHSPYETIGLTESDHLGRLYTFVKSLQEDLKPLKEGDKKTLSEWSLYLECLLEAYFASKEPQFEELKIIFKTFHSAEKAIGTTLYSWSSISHHLYRALGEEKVSYRERHLQAVRFCSMLPMRAIPAKVIAILGLGDGLFPKQQSHSPYDLMKNGSDYCPTVTDYDRFLFLEAILSARIALIISFCMEPTEKEATPSLIVSELISYLGQSYREIVTVHPFYSFDPKYFVKDGLQSYSRKDFYISKALGKNNKPHHFIPEWFEQSEKTVSLCEIQEERIILLNHLFGVAHNPLKSYFQETLSMKILDEEKVLDDEDHFLLDSLERYKIKQKALEKSFEEVIYEAKQGSVLPQGLFEELTIKKLQEEIGPWDHLEKIKVTLDPNCKVIEKPTKNHYVAPPIEIDGVFLVGEIPDLTTEGLFYSGRGDLSDTYKIWPKLLVLNVLDIPELCKKVIWAKSETIRTYAIEDPKFWLKKWIQYYLTCLKHPSPLHSILIEDVLKNKQINKKWAEDRLWKYQREYNWLRSNQEWDLSHLKQWRKIINEVIDWKNHLIS